MTEDELLDEANRQTRREQAKHLLTCLGPIREKTCLDAPETHKAHPLQRLLRYIERGDHSSTKDTQLTLINTDSAVRLIRREDGLSDWLDQQLAQACQLDELSNSASKLAEIRALGSLLEAGFDVKPIATTKTPTPDFQIVGGGQNVFVEVHCKQMLGNEARALMEFKEARSPRPGPDGIAFRYHEVRPAGGSDEETNVENVAQKFAQIKPKSKQAVSGALNVLWLDLQDEDMWALRPDHAVAISSQHYRFYVGGLWLAFFGKRGTPLLEHHHLHYEPNGVAALQRMRFDGRFRQAANRFDGAVLSFPDATVVFDNPWASTPPSLALMDGFMHMLRFDLALSWMDWPCPGTLLQRVAGMLAEINAVATHAGMWSYPDTVAIAGLDDDA